MDAFPIAADDFPMLEIEHNPEKYADRAFRHIEQCFGGSSEKAEYFITLLEPDRVVLSGSSMLQIRMDKYWEESDLDIVAIGIHPESTEMVHLIHRFTVPPLNYAVTRTLTRFHFRYRRLRRDVHTIVCFAHPRPGSPRIQIIFARTNRFFSVRQFLQSFDIHNVQCYIDRRLELKGYWSSVAENGVIYANTDVLFRQTEREWLRFFERVVKYQDRGLELSKDDRVNIYFAFCDQLQYRPGARPRNTTQERNRKAKNLTCLIERPKAGLRVTAEADGSVFKVQSGEDPRLETIIPICALPSLYDYQINDECMDLVRLRAPKCDNPLGIKIIFQNKCTTYGSFKDFNKAIRFFRPCVKIDGVSHFKAQPTICRIPLVSGNIAVYAGQLRDCIFRRAKNVPLVVVIEGTPFTTYDETMSEAVLDGLSSYVSANHCQAGSDMSVHLCRTAFIRSRKKVEAAGNAYFDLLPSTRDADEPMSTGNEESTEVDGTIPFLDQSDDDTVDLEADDESESSERSIGSPPFALATATSRDQVVHQMMDDIAQGMNLSGEQ
jgi:hypothetical protein